MEPRTYLFFLRWTKNQSQEVECGKFVRVKAFDISEAYNKLHRWAKNTEYHHAVVEKVDVLSKVEAI